MPHPREVQLTDTATGPQQVYRSELGSALELIRDTGSFLSCA